MFDPRYITTRRVRPVALILRKLGFATTALYERFASRGEADYQDRLLSVIRFGFGWQLEKSGQTAMKQISLHRILWWFSGHPAIWPTNAVRKIHRHGY
jgi:hypothetical protein